MRVMNIAFDAEGKSLFCSAAVKTFYHTRGFLLKSSFLCAALAAPALAFCTTPLSSMTFMGVVGYVRAANLCCLVLSDMTTSVVTVQLQL